MTHDTAFPFLTVLVLLPAGAAIAVALIPAAMGERAQRRAVYTLGLASSVATLALAVTIAVRYHAGNGGYRLVSQHVWAQSLGISWHLGVDGISVFLVLMAALLFPLAMVAGKAPARPRSFVAWMLLLEAGCLGSFVSLDLIMFFLFFELTLVPVYFVIAGWGFASRAYAAIKFFIYTFLGSAFLLVGIVAVAFVHQRQTGHLTFDLVALTSTHLGLASQVLLFLAFTAAFAVKAPIFPFHTWSPDAYAQSPTGGAVILAAVMAKMGTYGIIRFDLNLFPRAAVDLAPLLLTLGVIGILYGAIVACVTRDMKRLVAYSSLSHLGFIVLGTFALTTQGVTGGVLQMVNHGVSTGMLFLLFGVIYDRRHTRHIDDFGGLAKPMPVYAALFVVATLASVGLPGTNGFIGEFMVITGTATSTHLGRFAGVQAMGAAMGVVLGAIYMLMVVQKMFFGPITHKENKRLPDVTARELVSLAPLAMLIFVVGLFPNIFLSQIKGAAERVASDFESRIETNPAPKFYEGPIKLAPRRPDAPKEH